MASTQFYAYLHCKPDGTPFYIGKGTLGRSKKVARTHNEWHNRTVAKYGAENILIGRLECSSEDIAFELERGLIKCLRRMGVKLTNVTDGGEGTSGYKHTPEQCAVKLGNTYGRVNKGKKQTPEHLAARARAMRGNTNPLGSKQSAETREKKRKAMTGKKHSPGACAKMSANRKGKPQTAARIAVIEAQMKPVWAGGVLYPSVTSAASAIGASTSSVRSAIRNSRPCKGVEVRDG